MANADMNINVGTTPNEASARKTGEALGRAAGAAANAAFLSSFNAIFRDIPVSNKRIPGGISMSTSQRAAIDTLMSIAGDSTQSGVNRRAAMKELISATREYARKTPHSIEAQVGAQAAVALGQEAINISAGLDRATRNKKIKEATKIDTIRSAYEAALTDFNETGARLQAAEENGDSIDVAFARRKHLAAAKYLQNKRFKGVADKADIKRAEDVEKDHIRALKSNTQAMLFLNTSMAAVGAGAQITAAIASSFMQQHVDRNVFGSASAYAGRVKSAGSIGGGIAGAIGGGLLGGLLGPGGAIVGAQVGQSVLSALGGLPGEAMEKNLQGKQKTIADMQARIRAANMYRGAYSVSFGNAVQELGMATAGDMEHMVANSQTLGARMSFGQVGENEMLMYSLMPNYFAAAMAGASDAELAAAYAQDLQALPPMFRLWAGSMVGGGSAGMAAFAQDSFFGKTLGSAGKAHWLDQMMVAYSGAWQGGSVQRGLINAELATGEAMNATATALDELGIFDSNSGLRPVFAHTSPQSGSRVIANHIDLQNALSSGQMLQRKYEDIFQNSGYMFNEVTKLINKRSPTEYMRAQELLYGQWGPNESRNVVVQVYLDGSKTKEIQARGEAASKSGRMSVYSEIGY